MPVDWLGGTEILNYRPGLEGIRETAAEEEGQKKAQEMKNAFYSPLIGDFRSKRWLVAL